MKKPIIFALVAFLVALGGSTFLGLQKAKKAAAVAALAVAAHNDSVTAKRTADSLAAKDSTAKDGEKGGEKGGEQHAAAKDSVQAGPGDAPVAHADPTEGEPAKVIPAASGAKPVDPAEKAEAYKQVARVLSSMKAAEAVKVMAFLSDTEVEGILRAVGPRQAGDFLTNLPKERAATLSRRLLVPKPKAGQ